MSAISDAEKQEKKNKKQDKQVFLDFRSVLLQLNREKGIKINFSGLSEETGFTRQAILKWEKEAPPIVSMIFHFIKEHDLKFEDLVKEVVNHEK